MKRVGIWAAILLALPVWAEEAPDCPPEAATHVSLGARRFAVEVAASPEARQRGLSGRAALAPGHGMWFVMPEPTWGGFWMRDMRFPLDLVWADDNARVIKVETLQPCITGPCPVHYPPRPTAYVLEVDAGQSQGRLGDTLRWQCAAH